LVSIIIFDLIDNQIKLGDLFTSFAVLVSVASLIHTLNKDRLLRQRQQADIVRKAAALLMAKLDRWSGLSLSLFDRIDPQFVSASESLPEKEFDLQYIRDYLWKDLNNIRVKIHEKVMEEDIETSYIELYAYDPEARRYFWLVLSRLNDEEEIMFGNLSKGIQNIIFQFKFSEKLYTTSLLRNILKNYSDEIGTAYSQRINIIIKVIDNDLHNIISRSDKEILVAYVSC